MAALAGFYLMQLNQANRLTLLRILLSPLFLIFFGIGGGWGYLAALIVMIASETTDFMDGRLARSMGEATDFGKLMDPFADSIARLTGFACFLGASIIPTWLFMVFVYRDIMVSIIRVFAAKQGVVVHARRSGKMKAVAQATAIVSVLCFLVLESLFGMDSHRQLSFYIVMAASVVTVLSGIDYLLSNFKVFLVEGK